MTETRKYIIYTFGCQMNKLDSELIEAGLKTRGWAATSSEDDAALIIFNTCSVRKHAEDRVLSRLGKLKHLKKRRPEVIIGVTGCMAQKEHATILAKFPHTDFVTGPTEFVRIPEIVEEVAATRERVDATELRPDFDFGLRLDRPRPGLSAYVSILRGCDRYCSYCIVPYVRGPEVSRPAGEIVEEIRRLVDSGARETILLGQRVNAYGRKKGDTSFPRLLERCASVEGLWRLRFVTGHPTGMTREVFEAVRDNPVICPHLHMPMQSASDRILKLMNRGYTGAGYRRIVDEARSIVPGIEIVSDFIVGFPTESDEEYMETRRAVEEIGFLQAYVFKYSEREGTRCAADYPDDVPDEAKKFRNNDLLACQKSISAGRNKAMIGKEIEVLIEGESPRNKDKLIGRTRQFHLVIVDAPKKLAGPLVQVKIESATALALYGAAMPQER